MVSFSIRLLFNRGHNVGVCRRPKADVLTAIDRNIPGFQSSS